MDLWAGPFVWGQANTAELHSITDGEGEAENRWSPETESHRGLTRAMRGLEPGMEPQAPDGRFQVPQQRRGSELEGCEHGSRCGVFECVG